MKLRSQYAISAVGVLACASGCAQHAAGSSTAEHATASPGAIRVVAAERVYGDVARQIGGDAVSIVTILNSPTADPHAYEPSTSDADAIAAADIVIANGLGYDAFVGKLLAASPNAGRVVVEAGTLNGHRIGDNPHVWYEAATLERVARALADAIAAAAPRQRANIVRRRDRFIGWVRGFEQRARALGARRRGARVAITEPVFDYVIRAAGLSIATPTAFSHAIEEGNDPAPQDLDTMRALLAKRDVAAFVYNRQTVEPSTERLLAVAESAGVPVVSVTETLPAGETTQAWIDGEVAALQRAL